VFRLWRRRASRRRSSFSGTALSRWMPSLFCWSQRRDRRHQQNQTKPPVTKNGLGEHVRLRNSIRLPSGSGVSRSLCVNKASRFPGRAQLFCGNRYPSNYTKCHQGRQEFAHRSQIPASLRLSPQISAACSRIRFTATKSGVIFFSSCSSGRLPRRAAFRACYSA